MKLSGTISHQTQEDDDVAHDRARDARLAKIGGYDAQDRQSSCRTSVRRRSRAPRDRPGTRRRSRDGESKPPIRTYAIASMESGRRCRRSCRSCSGISQCRRDDGAADRAALETPLVTGRLGSCVSFSADRDRAQPGAETDVARSDRCCVSDLTCRRRDASAERRDDRADDDRVDAQGGKAAPPAGAIARRDRGLSRAQRAPAALRCAREETTPRRRRSACDRMNWRSDAIRRVAYGSLLSHSPQRSTESLCTSACCSRECLHNRPCGRTRETRRCPSRGSPRRASRSRAVRPCRR